MYLLHSTRYECMLGALVWLTVVKTGHIPAQRASRERRGRRGREQQEEVPLVGEVGGPSPLGYYSSGNRGEGKEYVVCSVSSATPLASGARVAEEASLVLNTIDMMDALWEGIAIDRLISADGRFVTIPWGSTGE